MTEAAREAAADLSAPGFVAESPRDEDGVPRGQPVLDRLVALLDLERIEEDIFRGVSPAESPVRVFGGQVAGQALVAAGRTVPVQRRVHSLHAYFIRGGDPNLPIVYEVDRIRDGRSFTTRRVVAVQRGNAIFSLSASFQVAERGLEHAQLMPAVPPPEQIAGYAERVRGVAGQMDRLTTRPRPIDLRYVDDPPWVSRVRGPRVGHNRVWMRADGVLPDDDLLHVCVLAYASDITLLDAVLTRHGVAWEIDGVVGASLDHAMWFHRPFRVDDWVLYDCTSPTASNGRGLATGHFYTRDGTLVATAVQEGMVRIRR